jgi:hypothetical protein
VSNTFTSVKTPLSLLVIRCAPLVVVAVAIGLSAPATNAAPQNGTVAPAVPGGGNEIGMLDEAYGLLRRADHDYKGHRARAMRKIEEAAKALGGTVGGRGKGHEAQGSSDAQLRSAQSLLQQAASGLTSAPRHHIEEAIKQLNIALSVK